MAAMWRAWPHLRRIWAAAGAISVGLIVTYLYSLVSRQPLPDLRLIIAVLANYAYWFGAGIVALGIVSFIAEREHRRHKARAATPASREATMVPTQSHLRLSASENFLDDGRPHDGTCEAR